MFIEPAKVCTYLKFNGRELTSLQLAIINEMNCVMARSAEQLHVLPYREHEGSTTLYEAIKAVYGHEVGFITRHPSGGGSHTLAQYVTTPEFRSNDLDLIIVDYGGCSPTDIFYIREALVNDNSAYHVIVR